MCKNACLVVWSRRIGGRMISRSFCWALPSTVCALERKRKRKERMCVRERRGCMGERGESVSICVWKREGKSLSISVCVCECAFTWVIVGISEGYKVKDIHSLVKCNAVSTEQHSTVIRTSFCRSRRALLHSASFCFNLFNTTGMVPAGFLRRRSRISVAWSPYSLFGWWRKEWRGEWWRWN